MPIKPGNRQWLPLGSPACQREQAPAQARQPEPDTVVLNRSEALARAWQETPDVRPEQVVRAKALLMDDSYPNAEVVARIAGLMARRK